MLGSRYIRAVKCQLAIEFELDYIYPAFTPHANNRAVLS